MNKKIIALLITSTFLVACKGGSNDSPSNNNPQDPVKNEIVIIPESEVIFQKASDGYTYNEPMPIQDDWIIEESNGEIPATIDESKLSSSWYIPSDYTEFQKAKNGEISFEGVIGVNRNKIEILFNYKINKSEVSTLIQNITNENFYFGDSYSIIEGNGILNIWSYSIIFNTNSASFNEIATELRIKSNELGSKFKIITNELDSKKLLPDFKNNLDAQKEVENFTFEPA